MTPPPPTQPEEKVNEVGRGLSRFCEWVFAYQASRQDFLDQIFEIVSSLVQKHLSRDTRLNWSGSHAVGLHLPWSDLNFEIKQQKRFDPEQVEEFQTKCLAMSRFFSASSLEKKEFIFILKLRMTSEFRDQVVEIIFKQQKLKDELVKEQVISTYLRQLPLSKPLYLVLRSLLHRHKLDDPSSGGMVSLAFFLMIVGFIQYFEQVRNPPVPAQPRTSLDPKASQFHPDETEPAKSDCLSDSKALGEAFICFLQVFGFSFDYLLTLILPLGPSQTVGSPFQLKSESTKYMHSLTILHPYSKDIIITKNFKRTQELRGLFQSCYVQMFANCCCSSDKLRLTTPSEKPGRICLSYREKLPARPPQLETPTHRPPKFSMCHLLNLNLRPSSLN